MREDWVECTFEDITSNLKRGPFGGDLKKEMFVESGYKVYEQQHAINNDFTIGRYYVNEEHFNNLKACEALPGDYIVSCSGTLGKIARIPTNSPKGIINQALLRIRIEEKVINHNYFIQFFKSSHFQQKILSDTRGSGMQNMAGIKEIKPIKLFLPPLPEQRAIVKKIEALFSSLDAGIADLKKAEEQLKIYRQAVLKKAFEGENEGGTQIEVNKITASLASNRYLHKLGSVISLQGGFAFKSAEFTPTGIPIVKIANVNLDNINWDEISYVSNDRLDEFKNYSLSEGDVLIAMTRPVIKSLNTVKTVIVKKGDLPCLLNQRVGRFLIKDNKVSKEYLQYFIKSTFFKDPIVREANDSLLPNISGKTIENFDIILPKSLQEQAQIVKEIEGRLSVCDAVEQQIKYSLSQAEALRQSTLKKAFEGKLLIEEEIKACQQAPDYEPAAVLLEKIKAEKVVNKTVKKTVKDKTTK